MIWLVITLLTILFLLFLIYGAIATATHYLRVMAFPFFREEEDLWKDAQSYAEAIASVTKTIKQKKGSK